MERMDRCPACDAEREANESPCAYCGAAPMVRLSPELQLRPRPRPAATAAQMSAELDATLELAFDPREPDLAAMVLAEPRVLARETSEAELARAEAADHDASDDARLLADYGALPRHWVLSAPYAWRVLQRRRVIKRALVLRTQEAARATETLEDALVALAERIRPVAEKTLSYMETLDMVGSAERVLRSRDAVLASEHDAQTARLASIDARLSKLESELALSRVEAREAATAIVSLQGILTREESNLKRAEAELRSTQIRAPSGSHE
jgi:hypothetical protein